MTRIELPTLTPSRAKDLICPKQFNARHIARSLPKEGWSRHLSYGEGIHAALHTLYDPATGTSPMSRNVTRAVQAAFARQHYPDATLRAEDSAKAILLITNYIAQDTDADHTVGVETWWRFTGGKSADGMPITFSARVDRQIVRPDNPGVLRIVDYKTGSPGSVDMDGATVLFAISRRAAQKAGYAEAILQYDYVGETGLVDRQEVTVDQARAVWPDLLARAQRVYYGSDFPANPGPQCQLCPLNRECNPADDCTGEDLGGLLD